MIGTFLASEVRILCRLLESYGIDGLALCREAGLNPALVNEPRARYPFDRVAIAHGLAAERTGNPHLGLEAAKFYRATDFHGLAVVFLASNCLRTALERLVRYQGVVNTAVRSRLEQRKDSLNLFYSVLDIDENARRVLQDSRAAIMVDLCRNGSSADLNPLEVAFTYPKPKDTSAHAALFRCPLIFDAQEWRLSFGNEDAQRPFLASNRDLARSNDQILDQVVKGLRQDDLVSRVEMAMVEELPSGTPSEESIAKAVSMSTRSLQRRLSEEGTSFTELLAVVRRQLAEQYVQDRHIPVTEISYMLGFSDVSSFSRAFKRWTGKSPAFSRQQALPH